MIVLFRVAWVLSGVEGYQANMELRFVGNFLAREASILSFRSLKHSYFSYALAAITFPEARVTTDQQEAQPDCLSTAVSKCLF